MVMHGGKRLMHALLADTEHSMATSLPFLVELNNRADCGARSYVLIKIKNGSIFL